MAQLHDEFGREFPHGTVNSVVDRLSANGAVSVPVLEHLARTELRRRLVVQMGR